VSLGFALAARNGGIDALGRFSRIIPFALLLVVAAGAALAVVQLQNINALWTTTYGNVFLIKLALLAPLFVLAALNRFRLTLPATAGDTAATGMLRRSVAMEVMLFLAIFAVVACWRFTPPPRALAEAAAAPTSTHIHTLKAMADLTITPGRTGPVTASMIIMTGEFGLLPAKGVTLTFANPVAGVEPITRQASQPGDGTWQIANMPIPAPGRWSVRIDILVSDFEMVRLDGEIDIRR
jgi:copper transport protein